MKRIPFVFAILAMFGATQALAQSFKVGEIVERVARLDVFLIGH